ncbi:hypothetical protein ACO1PK_01045 [Alishewanella sp. d11]|uniref:hypothetical protein n=1 Tax=Alishewanella sp. d11 TaxID=3414030 RepID=UPI003BF894B9
MNIVEVNEAQFRKQLERWHTAGRTLLNLPNVERKAGKLTISFISLDNGTTFVLKNKFHSYHELLSWYGKLIDQVEQT